MRGSTGVSYDLYLKPRHGTLGREDFDSYFGKRHHYKLNAGQAYYDNEETGVYFSFDWVDPAARADEDGEFYPAYFNLNYYRPSCFVLEAEGEVSAFVRAFDLVAHDPQMHGMGDGEYDAARLHTGWNAGNQSAYDILLEEPDLRSDLQTLPTEAIRYVWRWNYGRETLQDSVGNTKFVPRIMLLEVEGRTGTAMVWPDGIPLVATPVDWLILSGDKLLQRRPEFEGGKRLLPWAEAMSIVGSFAKQRSDLVVTFDYDEAPPEVFDKLSRLPPEPRSLYQLSPGTVLDREMVERALEALPKGSP
jgi:hypothetical protein